MKRHTAAPDDKIHKSKGRVILREAQAGWRHLAMEQMQLGLNESSLRLSRTKQVQWEDRQDELAKQSLACMCSFFLQYLISSNKFTSIINKFPKCCTRQRANGDLY